MKKTLAVLLVLMIALSGFSAAVSAQEIQSPDRPDPSRIAELITVRQQILDLRIQVLDLQREILGEIKANDNLRLVLIERLEQNRDSLSESTLATLKSLHHEVRVVQKILLDTRGDIGNLTKDLRALNPKEDLEEMVAIYHDILDIQSDRLEKVRAVGDLLEQMMGIDWN